MRRTRILDKFSRDEGAMAPYAVVAVVILLGAAMSYAYLAHLQTTRMELDGADPWTDEAIRALDDEEARIQAAVQRILETVSEGEDRMAAKGLVSSLAIRGQDAFSLWVDANYPSHRGHVLIEVSDPRFTLGTLFSTVTTGNVLGQQVPQQLPVGLEAVGAARVDVHVGDGSSAGRDVAVRAETVAPQVLAAHLQNVLEYSLANEGLCSALIIDAISTKLATEPYWEPADVIQVWLVRGSIAAVQRSLFHNDTIVPWLPDQLDGPDLLGDATSGRVSLQPFSDVPIDVTCPRGGLTHQVEFVPRLEWLTSPQVQLRTSGLWGAEEGGEATLARFDMAGFFQHTVEVRLDGLLVGNVTREIGFRDHLTAWAMDATAGDDNDPHYGRAQVEDWASFKGTMAVVSPPPSVLRLDVPSSFGDQVEVSLDGVHLGIYDVGTNDLPNVPSGPHEVMVVSRTSADAPATCSTQVMVSPEGDITPMRPVPSGEGLSRAEHAFWFSIMAAFHRTDAGSLAHLEHIASLAGYPLLPSHIADRPEDDLDAVAFWVEGLEHHLEYMGGKWDDKGVSDPVSTLDQAKQVVKLSKLAYKLLVKLPKEVRKVSRATVILSTQEGRTEFRIWSETGAGPKDLLKGTADETGCTVRATAALGGMVAKVDNVLTAISILTSALTVVYDTVEFVGALEGGDTEEVIWAYVDLQLDMAKLVLSVLNVLGKVGLVALGAVGRAMATVIGAAISVVSLFLDAYREAGNDFWGAWDLLLHPDWFSAALRTAGFFSAMATLVTTAVLTVGLPILTGATMVLSMAVFIATGVGLIVFAAVLAIWVVLNWASIKNWISGTMADEDLDNVVDDVDSILAATMDMHARLNPIDVTGQVAEARTERGVGLSLMHVGTLSGNAGLVKALGNAGLSHLDGGSAQGRRARAVEEVKYWIQVLWREVDDLIDNDRGTSNGEDSEGFEDYKGSFGSQDHDYDGDIRVTLGKDMYLDLEQSTGGIERFLKGLDEEDLADMEPRLDIEGKVYADGLKDWLKSLGAINGQLGEATGALDRAGKETAFVSSVASEADYDRHRGVLRVTLPEGMSWAELEIWSEGGAVYVDGEPVEGRTTIEVEDGTALVVASGFVVQSRLVQWVDPEEPEDIVSITNCAVFEWHDINFGAHALNHVEEGAA